MFTRWFPFGKKEKDEPSALGAVTGCDLAELAPLVSPFVRDPFCRLRPAFSREALALSLELAEVAYTLEVEPWQQAGWTDFSILIDETLHDNLDGGTSLMGAFRLWRAKANLRERNPISQLKSALRQKEKSDTIKAVCMMHPSADGPFVLAIGLMGTGSRFYDWFSNLRFTTEEGFHSGFYQLCQSFEANAEEIEFPETARALGLEKLTLGQVFLEMRSLSSRFRLWMAGHSQGGAVMQVLTHRLMNDWGVLPQNMVGYGFASPTVATGRLVYDPASYPLYHVINNDDLVPCLGALLHLGLCQECRADHEMRSAVYDRVEDHEAFSMLQPFRRGITDTPSAIVHMTALMECLAEEKGEDGLAELIRLPWTIAPLDRVLAQAGDRMLEMLDRLLDGWKRGYEDVAGMPMSDEALSACRETVRPVVRALSVRRLLGAIQLWSTPPHRLVRRTDPPADGAYAFIVKERFDMLRPFIWIKNGSGMPSRRYSTWAEARAWPEHEHASCIRARRQMRRTPERRGKMRLTPQR